MDVAILVQPLIHRTKVYRLVRESLAQGPHSLGRGQGMEKMKVARTTLLKQLTSRHSATAGC